MKDEYVPFAYMTPVENSEQNNAFLVTKPDGEKKIGYKLFSYESSETGKSYIVYSYNEKDEQGRYEFHVAIYRAGKKNLWLAPLRTGFEWQMAADVVKCGLWEIRELAGSDKVPMLIEDVIFNGQP